MLRNRDIRETKYAIRALYLEHPLTQTAYNALEWQDIVNLEHYIFIIKHLINQRKMLHHIQISKSNKSSFILDNRSKLVASTVPSSKNLVEVTVPPSKNLVDGPVPSSKNLVDGTLPSSKNLVYGTVSSSKDGTPRKMAKFKIKFQPPARGVDALV
jgi:hypothetical protein